MANVLTCYYRPKAGGFCLRLYRAIGALLDQGHTVHYLSLAPFPINHAQCIYHRFPWPVSQSDNLVFWAFFHLLAPLLLGYLALRHGITHAFAFGTTYAFLMRPLKWIKSLPVTCFLRSDALAAHDIKKKPGWLIRLEFRIEGLALHGIHVVGTTPHLVRAVTRRHPWVAVKAQHHLPNDLPEAQAASKRSFRKPLRLGMVGVIEEQKNHMFIIQMLNQWSNSDLNLHIYGSGPLEKTLKKLVQSNHLQGKVHFKGWVPSGRIWPQVDLLLMPSLQEWMPNAVLEAIANNVPVLASDIEGHRLILPPDHLLPLDQPGQWHAALDKLLADPETILRRMRNAQGRFAEHLCFDWDACVVAAILSTPNL